MYGGRVLRSILSLGSPAHPFCMKQQGLIDWRAQLLRNISPVFSESRASILYGSSAGIGWLQRIAAS